MLTKLSENKIGIILDPKNEYIPQSTAGIFKTDVPVEFYAPFVTEKENEKYPNDIYSVFDSQVIFYCDTLCDENFNRLDTFLKDLKEADRMGQSLGAKLPIIFRDVPANDDLRHKFYEVRDKYIENFDFGFMPIFGDEINVKELNLLLGFDNFVVGREIREFLSKALRTKNTIHLDLIENVLDAFKAFEKINSCLFGPGERDLDLFILDRVKDDVNL